MRADIAATKWQLSTLLSLRHSLNACYPVQIAATETQSCIFILNFFAQRAVYRAEMASTTCTLKTNFLLFHERYPLHRGYTAKNSTSLWTLAFPIQVSYALWKIPGGCGVPRLGLRIARDVRYERYPLSMEDTQQKCIHHCGVLI